MNLTRRHKRLILVLACVVCAAGAALVYSRLFYQRANPSAEEYPVRGIDISAHNGDIDFGALVGGSQVQFAYVKATEGTDFIDRNFIRNVKGLTRQGVPVGAYHFFRFDTDGEMQAWNFISAMRGRRLSLRPAIDVEEWANPSDPTTAQIMTQLRAMIAILRAEGHDPVIYTNKDGYHRFVKGKLDEHTLWICSFTDPPLGNGGLMPLWQYSHRGSIPGISGPVDLNAAPSLTPLLASGAALTDVDADDKPSATAP